MYGFWEKGTQMSEVKGLHKFEQRSESDELQYRGA